MTDESRSSSPTMSEDTNESISSLESPDGTSPCSLQDGQQLDLFGPAAAHASLSVPPDRARQPMTNDICGPTGSGLSTLYDRQQSLANRLSLQLAGAGSTLFTLTWQRKATPLGLPYYQLAVSGRPISETDCGSWPTPQTCEFETKSDHREKLRERWGNHFGDRFQTLGQAVQAASWPTPVATDDKFAGSGETDWLHHRGKKGIRLNDHVVHRGPISNGSIAATERRGQLNPAFSLWLQGFPEEWANSAPQVIRWSRKSRRNS